MIQTTNQFKSISDQIQCLKMDIPSVKYFMTFLLKIQCCFTHLTTRMSTFNPLKPTVAVNFLETNDGLVSWILRQSRWNSDKSKVGLAVKPPVLVNHVDICPPCEFTLKQQLRNRDVRVKLAETCVCAFNHIMLSPWPDEHHIDKI